MANLFMHYAFDTWLERNYPVAEFERYADDAIVHCVTECQARCSATRWLGMSASRWVGMTATGKAPPTRQAGPGGARVVVAVAGLSWSAVGACDGGGDQADVGLVEGAQDLGEVDGDVVVAEAGGDAQDAGF